MGKFFLNIFLAGLWVFIIGGIATALGGEPNYEAMFIGGLIGSFLPDYLYKK